jgi:hypothetical protein
MSLDKLEKLVDRLDAKADVLLAVVEFELTLEEAYVSLGVDRYNAFDQVRKQKKSDKEAFIADAVNLEAYRTRITDPTQGIPAEMFNHFVRINPAQVLADAAQGAIIHKQAVNSSILQSGQLEI